MQIDLPSDTELHPHRTQHRALFAICIALAAALLLAPARGRAQDSSAGGLGPQAQAIAQSVNLIRSQNGLAPLRVNGLLNQAAQNHVDDLIANGMYGHYGSDGSSVRTRVRRTGYASGLVSENWVTSGSAQGAMDWWMNDWIHKVNILDSSWDEVGVGVGQVGNGYFIYVTDFANSDGLDTSVAIAPPSDMQAVSYNGASSAELPADGLDYTIQGGDTLLAIGLRYGIEWQDIAQANSMGERDILSIGRKLHIPGRGAAAGESTNTPAAGGLLYTVISGDTLITIARRYAIDWNDIAAANRLSDFSVLQIGMQLRLPGVPEEGAAATANGSAEPKAEPATFVQKRGAVYVVKAGDTLVTIAARSKITWQALADLNGLDDDALLQIGQELELPAEEVAVSESNRVAASELPTPTPIAASTSSVALPTATPVATPIKFTTELLPAAPEASTAAASAGRSYTVKPGDTIISIAVRNNVGWKELLRINGLADDTLLQPGQVLALGN